MVKIKNYFKVRISKKHIFILFLEKEETIIL